MIWRLLLLDLQAINTPASKACEMTWAEYIYQILFSKLHVVRSRARNDNAITHIMIRSHAPNEVIVILAIFVATPR